MTRREYLRLTIGTFALMPLLSRVQSWYGTLGQWLYHAEHGVKRLWAAGKLVEVPGSAFSSIPSTFVRYNSSDRWVGHYETAHARILGWMDKSGRVWWAKQP